MRKHHLQSKSCEAQGGATILGLALNIVSVHLIEYIEGQSTGGLNWDFLWEQNFQRALGIGRSACQGC